MIALQKYLRMQTSVQRSNATNWPLPLFPFPLTPAPPPQNLSLTFRCVVAEIWHHALTILMLYSHPVWRLITRAGAPPLTSIVNACKSTSPCACDGLPAATGFLYL